MLLFLQGFPITSQNVDKLLSLDPLSLALIIGVVIVLTLLVNSWFQGRTSSAAETQQTAVIKFFTDDKSPMVTSNNRVAAALEQGNTRTAELNATLADLGKKTDNNTQELSKQTAIIEENTNTHKEFSLLVSKDLSMTTESMVDMRKSFDELRLEVRRDIEEISRKIDQLIQDKADCMKLREELNAFKGNVEEKMAEQEKRATSTQTTVVISDTHENPASDTSDKAA